MGQHVTSKTLDPNNNIGASSRSGGSAIPDSQIQHNSTAVSAGWQIMGCFPNEKRLLQKPTVDRLVSVVISDITVPQ